MKKLLSLLGVVAISATASSTLTINPFTLSEFNCHNLNLQSQWGRNINLLENWYVFLGHDVLIAYISHNTFQNIVFAHDTSNRSEFSNTLFSILNNFEKEDHSGGIGPVNDFPTSDVHTIKNVIIAHYAEIYNVFKNKSNSNIGIQIRTNRDSYWERNSNSWGVRDNSSRWG